MLFFFEGVCQSHPQESAKVPSDTLLRASNFLLLAPLLAPRRDQHVPFRAVDFTTQPMGPHHKCSTDRPDPSDFSRASRSSSPGLQLMVLGLLCSLHRCPRHPIWHRWQGVEARSGDGRCGVGLASATEATSRVRQTTHCYEHAVDAPWS